MAKWQVAQRGKRGINILLAALFLIFALLFIHSLREIVPQLEGYRVAQAEYQLIREVAWPQTGSGAQGSEYTEQSIDWAALRRLNPDIIGWIVVDGTTIDYPIVRGRDNEYYLHRTFMKEQNTSGAIFMDHRNCAGFFDPSTIIYGHNMQNGSMFAGLHDWTGNSFRIYTPSGVLEFEVFSKRTVAANDPMFSLLPVERCGRRVVTLSTCVFRQGDLRFIVQGILE